MVFRGLQLTRSGGGGRSDGGRALCRYPPCALPRVHATQSRVRPIRNGSHCPTGCACFLLKGVSVNGVSESQRTPAPPLPAGKPTPH